LLEAENKKEQSTYAAKMWVFWSLGCVAFLEAKKFKLWSMIAKLPKGHSGSDHSIGIGSIFLSLEAEKRKLCKMQWHVGLWVIAFARSNAIMSCGGILVFCQKQKNKRTINLFVKMLAVWCHAGSGKRRKQSKEQATFQKQKKINKNNQTVQQNVWQNACSMVPCWNPQKIEDTSVFLVFGWCHFAGSNARRNVMVVVFWSII